MSWALVIAHIKRQNPAEIKFWFENSDNNIKVKPEELISMIDEYRVMLKRESKVIILNLERVCSVSYEGGGKNEDNS